MAQCSNCRREVARYQVGTVVLGFRCLRSAKDARVPVAFKAKELKSWRREKRLMRKLKGRGA